MISILFFCLIIGPYGCLSRTYRGTLLQDNIDPIAKVERSSLILASIIHGVPVSQLLAGGHSEHLIGLFPEFMET